MKSKEQEPERKAHDVPSAARERPPTAWRRFKLWAGFPEYEDLPRCGGCGERVTIGEYPVYPWVCRNPTTKECWR